MQSMSLEKMNLGERGLQYVREQLSDAAPFSEGLSRYLDSGYAWEFTPEEQRMRFLQKVDFHVGGGDAVASAVVLGEYIAFLCELLREDPTIVLLFENQLFKLTDPVMLGKIDVFEWMGATYSYLPAGTIPVTESVVAEHLRGASRYPSVVLATRSPEPLRIQQTRQLTNEDASVLEANVQHILVGARDEESYVAWSRQW